MRSALALLLHRRDVYTSDSLLRGLSVNPLAISPSMNPFLQKPLVLPIPEPLGVM